MKDKKLAIYICFSILIVLLSFVVYYGFSSVTKTNIQNTAFTFLVLSEVLFFVMIYLVSIKQESTFSKAGISSASTIYFLASLVLNIFIKNMFETVRALVTTNIILLILFISIVLIIFLFKKEN